VGLEEASVAVRIVLVHVKGAASKMAWTGCPWTGAFTSILVLVLSRAVASAAANSAVCSHEHSKMHATHCDWPLTQTDE